MSVSNTVVKGYQPISEVKKTMWVFYAEKGNRCVRLTFASEGERLRLKDELVWEDELPKAAEEEGQRGEEDDDDDLTVDSKSKRQPHWERPRVSF